MKETSKKVTTKLTMDYDKIRILIPLLLAHENWNKTPDRKNQERLSIHNPYGYHNDYRKGYRYDPGTSRTQKDVKSRGVRKKGKV